ncbi:NADPH-dependent FMN reductase, partial [Pararobbsia alpina]|uniref:NADPH-dependent FMN reductase n=1 Tax=Pararobbsia alpina TaxID=621374 RepID=UPI0015834B9B
MTAHTINGDEGFPAARTDFFDTDIAVRLGMEGQPPVRILLLYGSLRERSYSRLLVEEAARLLQTFGAETRIFDPRGLPHADDVDVKNHP